jgi:hypothetical protein
MSQIYNIYCDESCHLENDSQKAMVLGGVWIAEEKVKQILARIKEIKVQHGLKSDFEIKWTKISPAKTDFYINIIDYFFDTDDLNFRCIVVPDKKLLDHKKYHQNHDDFYYKLYFDMLKTIFDPNNKYNIYIDIKDTNGSEKIKKLHEILCNNIYDFDRKIVSKVQTVRSHEIGVLQITDLLIGAVSHFSRNNNFSSEAKKKIISRIEKRTGYSLEKSTLSKERKFNMFIWEASYNN